MPSDEISMPEWLRVRSLTCQSCSRSEIILLTADCV